MHHYRIFVLTAFVLLGVMACERHTPWLTTNISGVMPDLAFSLQDEKGNRVEASDYLGKVTLLFFGYTYCPDVCPTTLSKISSVLKRLPDSQRQNTQVLFVSVDPARDTPEQLSVYTAVFGDEFIGLTGSQEQLKRLTRRYRLTYGYGNKDSSGNYEVSHSSGIFVFDKQGQVKLLIPDSSSQDDMAHDLSLLLQEDE